MPLREALDERAVVERRAELGPVHPVVPELRVVGDPVERDVDRLHAVRPGSSARLVLLAQVDDRSHAVVAERSPAVGAEAVDRLGADQRAAARHAAVDRRQAAEVAGVDAAVPVEVAVGAQTDAPQLGSSSATRKEEPQPHEATTFGFETSNPEPMKVSVKSTVEPSTY